MLLGKPYHNKDLLLKRDTSSNINLQKEEQQEAKLSAICSILHYSEWLQQYCPLTYPPANRTEWTPQVTVPSRDKCLILKTLQKKNRRGEDIWKPDLDMDTWSDAGQKQNFLTEGGSSFVPDQYSPWTSLFTTPHTSKLNWKWSQTKQKTTDFQRFKMLWPSLNNKNFPAELSLTNDWETRASSLRSWTKDKHGSPHKLGNS